MRWPRLSWRVIAVAVVAAIVCLALLALLVLVSQPGRQWVLARIERELISSGIGFRARDIHYQVFSPRVTIDAPESPRREYSSR